jgi:hypothetical protein
MKTLLAVCICTILVFFYVDLAIGEQPEQQIQSQQDSLTMQDKLRYEMLARSWANRLWSTNDCYTVVFPKVMGTLPSWTFRGIWSNEFQKSKARIYQEKFEESIPWKYVVADFLMKDTNRTVTCIFRFVDTKTDQIQSIHNGCFYAKNVPYRKDGKPIHTTEQQARAKAAEYAAMFGVSNLWDKTKFLLRSPCFSYGSWTYCLTPKINGYDTLYAISISVADMPGIPLGEWMNTMDQIPANIPTNVVLTATQARGKAETYLKQYFPLKPLVPKMTFMTNSLEYVTPNYNYIRPADETGFSKHVPQKDSIALAWRNYFKRPAGVSFGSFPVIIDVDAATGEMLGGSD